VNPENLLASGYTQTLQDTNIKGGAATACLGVYRRDGVLSTAKYVSRWESIEKERRGGGADELGAFVVWETQDTRYFGRGRYTMLRNRRHMYASAPPLLPTPTSTYNVPRASIVLSSSPTFPSASAT
jgi:hypothetical protein